MQYWGAEVKIGEQLKVVPGEGRIVHISKASLGQPIKKKRSQSVYLFVEFDGVKSVLGTLFPNEVPQQVYDLAFDGDFKLSHNWKYGSVYFFGYKSDYPGKQKVKIVEPNGEDDYGPMCEDEKAALQMNGEDDNDEEALKKAIDASLIAWFIDDSSDTKDVSESVARIWENEEFIKELHNVVIEKNQFLIFDLLRHAREFIEEPVEDRVSRIKNDCFFERASEEQGSVGKMRGLISILLGYWLSEDVLSEQYKAMEGFDFPGSAKNILSCWRKRFYCSAPSISNGSAAVKQELKIVESNKEGKAEDDDGPMCENEKSALMNGEDDNDEEALKKAIDASLIAWFIDDRYIHILAEKVADDAELSLIANDILNFLRYNPGSYTKDVSESVARFWKNKEFIKELHNVVIEKNQFLIFDLLRHAREFIEEPVEDRVSRIKKDCFFERASEEQGSVGKMRGVVSILLGYWLSKDVLCELYNAMEGFDFPGSAKRILSCWKKR